MDEKQKSGQIYGKSIIDCQEVLALKVKKT